MVFDLKILVSHGWCTLKVSDGSRGVEISNHWVNNRFTELVRSVLLLFDGHDSACCRWQREVIGGSFIDFARSPEDILSLVIHDFYYGSEASSAAEVYSARRGAAVFTTEVTMGAFAKAFAAELRKIKVFNVDSSGVVIDWKAPFPEREFQLIEQRAATFGYHPKSIAELQAATP